MTTLIPTKKYLRNLVDKDDETFITRCNDLRLHLEQILYSTEEYDYNKILELSKAFMNYINVKFEKNITIIPQDERLIHELSLYGCYKYF